MNETARGGVLNMARRIWKGGRPRKIKSEHDFGSPELIAKRAALSQGDPTLSTCPLDVLLSRKHISPGAHTAAMHFLSCFVIVHGSPHPRAIDLNQISGGAGEYDDERAENEYNDACEALLKVSRRLFDIVHNIVIYERTPLWLVNPLAGNGWDRKNAGQAFATLLGWYSGRNRKAA